MLSIHERSASIEERAAPGHREGERLFGQGRRHIATLAERPTPQALIAKISEDPDRSSIEKTGKDGALSESTNGE
jgi:IS30 family transposase